MVGSAHIKYIRTVRIVIRRYLLHSQITRKNREQKRWLKHKLLGAFARQMILDRGKSIDVDILQS